MKDQQGFLNDSAWNAQVGEESARITLKFWREQLWVELLVTEMRKTVGEASFTGRLLVLFGS